MSLGAVMQSPGWRVMALAVAMMANAACAIGARTVVPVAQGQATGPNIILIMVDDLGWGDLGVYGQELIATPEIDEMAGEGLRFTQFYSAAPHCNPARASLMSGLHTGHTQLRNNSSLTVTEPTLADLAKSQGYVTAMFGKWGVADVGDDDLTISSAPFEFGFDHFLGQLTHRDAHMYFLDSPPKPPGTPEQPYYDDVRQFLYASELGAMQTVTLPPDRYVHDELIEESLAFIDLHKEERFFLYLPLMIPHAELAIPEDESIEAYLDEKGVSIFEERPWRPAPDGRLYDRWNERPRATFAAMISRLSRDVGQIRNLLETLEIAENTIVMLTSDNGPHSAGGIRSPEFFNSAGGLSGMKWSLLEGGLRVPMIIVWPGTITPATVDTPAALWDIAPTIANLTGLTDIGPRDGVSFAPLLTDPQSTLAERHFYWETFNGLADYRQAVRKGDLKALRRVDDDYVELYDVVADPAESEDLSVFVAYCDALVELKSIMNSDRTTPLVNPDGEFDIAPIPETCTAEILLRDDFGA